MSARDRSSLDGFSTVRSVLELDELTLQRGHRLPVPRRRTDLRLTPWKKATEAAIRSAFGN